MCVLNESVVLIHMTVNNKSVFNQVLVAVEIRNKGLDNI